MNHFYTFYKEICIKFNKLDPSAIIPSYAHKGDSGMDLYSIDYVHLPPMTHKLIRTGLQLDIPDGYEVQVRSKSGLAVKHSLFVLNSPGTIDSSYTGELCVILFNLNSASYTVEKGQKIAQMVVCPVVNAIVVEDHVNKESSRNDGGFGSTGLK